MYDMEVALVSNNSIRLKGKQGTFIINPSGKVAGANGVILLGNHAIASENYIDETVYIKGPGEYEIAGVKLSGLRNSLDTVFSIRMDNIEILVGRAESLEKDSSKLKEHNIVILYADTKVDPSFVTTLTTNVVMMYGEHAEETIKIFAKEAFKQETKYQTTAEKLSTEMEEILLQ